MTEKKNKEFNTWQSNEVIIKVAQQQTLNLEDHQPKEVLKNSVTLSFVGKKKMSEDL